MRVASAQSLDTSVIKLIPKVLRKSVDLVSQLVVCTAVSTSPCMLSAMDQPPKLIIHPRFITLSAFNNLGW